MTSLHCLFCIIAQDRLDKDSSLTLNCKGIIVVTNGTKEAKFRIKG